MRWSRKFVLAAMTLIGASTHAWSISGTTLSVEAPALDDRHYIFDDSQLFIRPEAGHMRMVLRHGRALPFGRFAFEMSYAPQARQPSYTSDARVGMVYQIDW